MGTGVLVDWNDERGFGFIEEDGRRTFVHVSAFDLREGRPTAGDEVHYSVGTAPDGRPRAVQADLIRTRRRAGDATRAEPERGRIRMTPLVLAGLFLLGLTATVLLLDLPRLLPLVYLVMTVATFALYAADKRAATAGEWRTAESTLHLAALLGGWPGAALAQQLLRHKNRKAGFQAMFWVTVVINLAACAVLVLWFGSDLPIPGIR